MDSLLCLCGKPKEMCIFTTGILELSMLIDCKQGIEVPHGIISFMLMTLIRHRVTYSKHVEIMIFHCLVLVTYLLLLI